MKQLRKYTGIALLASAACLLTTACSEKDETFTTFPAPTWSVNPAEYSVNMTAVVQLPSFLIQHAHPEDQLAAFTGETCLGKGEAISEGLFFVTIHGTADAEPPVHFKYYSAKTRYLYATGELFAFEADRVFGVVDDPETLTLTSVK